MKEALTHNQKAVSQFLAQSAPNVSLEFRAAFMKAAFLALRAHRIPSTLVSRNVQVSPWAKTNARQIFALLVEGRPIGFGGSVGWKQLSQDILPAGSTLVFLQSTNKADHHEPAAFKNNTVVRALFSKAAADLAANLVGLSTPSAEHVASPNRL